MCYRTREYLGAISPVGKRRKKPLPGEGLTDERSEPNTLPRWRFAIGSRCCLAVLRQREELAEVFTRQHYFFSPFFSLTTVRQHLPPIANLQLVGFTTFISLRSFKLIGFDKGGSVLLLLVSK